MLAFLTPLTTPNNNNNKGNSQKFLRHFFVSICAAGLTLRRKQKTMVARQLEKLNQSVRYLHKIQDANIIQKSYILLYMVPASPRSHLIWVQGVLLLFF